MGGWENQLDRVSEALKAAGGELSEQTRSALAEALSENQEGGATLDPFFAGFLAGVLAERMDHPGKPEEREPALPVRDSRFFPFGVPPRAGEDVTPIAGGVPLDPPGPQPIQPGLPSDPEVPQPIQPGPPSDPEGPQPIQPGPPSDPEGPQPIQPGPPSDPEGPQPVEPSGPGEPGEPGEPGGPEGISSRWWEREWFEDLSVLVVDEFLAAEDLRAIRDYALANQAQFEESVVARPDTPGGSVSPSQRRSLVLDQLEHIGSMFAERLESSLPRVLEHFDLGELTPQAIDIQMTATNHNEYFRAHMDSGSRRFRSRQLSFVYFFHDEPVPFTGGELKLYHVAAYDEVAREHAPSRIVKPRQNTIVFFPSQFLHEILTVDVPSRRFEDSRFTVNGWIHW